MLLDCLMGIGTALRRLLWTSSVVADTHIAGDEGDSEVARRVQVILEDDIDGQEAQETLTFALDGRAYEIDLSQTNAAKLRDVFAPWIAAGRRAGTTSARKGAEPTPRRSRSEDSGTIRRWAADNGIEVSSRGRIPAEVRAKYEAAH